MALDNGGDHDLADRVHAQPFRHGLERAAPAHEQLRGSPRRPISSSSASSSPMRYRTRNDGAPWSGPGNGFDISCTRVVARRRPSSVRPWRRCRSRPNSSVQLAESAGRCRCPATVRLPHPSGCRPATPCRRYRDASRRRSRGGSRPCGPSCRTWTPIFAIASKVTVVNVPSVPRRSSWFNGSLGCWVSPICAMRPSHNVGSPAARPGGGIGLKSGSYGARAASAPRRAGGARGGRPGPPPGRCAASSRRSPSSGSGVRTLTRS